VSNLYKANPILFWLLTCFIAGIIWGFFNASLAGGLIYGGILFLLAGTYEIFRNKRNRPKD
jgi:hypothetical protein